MRRHNHTVQRPVRMLISQAPLASAIAPRPQCAGRRPEASSARTPFGNLLLRYAALGLGDGAGNL
jgi:hypothetical protein